MKSETELIVKLTLTATEALWLKGICQNPIGHTSVADEPDYDQKIRKAFFDALPAFTELDENGGSL